eukprot:TRINITY_DN10949_c0_g1_i1.p1 TRINITY_DN10949_c0_g1~~TRINITY_DN10949_c0_g1_i1.p1  ORF type:complete len:107 (-),score=13.71 TRINITY_DN10949_c0_g1_i1:154-474(-)
MEDQRKNILQSLKSKKAELERKVKSPVHQLSRGTHHQQVRPNQGRPPVAPHGSNHHAQIRQPVVIDIDAQKPMGVTLENSFGSYFGVHSIYDNTVIPVIPAYLKQD